MKYRPMRIYALCVGFCLVMLGLVSAVELTAKKRALREADRFSLALNEVFAGTVNNGAILPDKIVTIIFEDELDDDTLFSSDRSLSATALIAFERLRGRRAQALAYGIAPAGLNFNWRTQTLGWAADREKQYSAISQALADAQRKGVRVQIIARGRGADIMLETFRRGGPPLADRILIIGRAPEAGDEKMSAHVAFYYPTSDAVVMAYADDNVPFSRLSGTRSSDLLLNAAETFETGQSFRQTDFEQIWPVDLVREIEGLILTPVPINLPRFERRGLTIARNTVFQKWQNFLRDRDSFQREFAGTLADGGARDIAATKRQAELTRQANAVIDEAEAFNDSVADKARDFRSARRF